MIEIYGYSIATIPVIVALTYGIIDYTGGIISMNVNLDHIKAICRKPMKKVPKGLSDYGITSEEVEEMFLDFCEADEANYNKGGRKLT